MDSIKSRGAGESAMPFHVFSSFLLMGIGNINTRGKGVPAEDSPPAINISNNLISSHCQFLKGDAMLHSHIARRVLRVDKLLFCNQGVELQFSKRVNADYSMAQ